MSDMVIKVVNACIYAISDMIDEVCRQDDFERNKIRRNRRKKVDTSMWQETNNKKTRSNGDNEYSLHFHVHREEMEENCGPHISCNTPWTLQYFINDHNVSL